MKSAHPIDFHTPVHGFSASPSVTIEDKVVLGTIYGAEIWILDHSMTWLSSQLWSLPPQAQGLILIGIFLFALCAPFFMARKLFEWSSWQALKHDKGDRIIVVLFGVMLPMAFDSVLLHWISPSNFVMTFLYAVVSVFGVLATSHASESVVAGSETLGKAEGKPADSNSQGAAGRVIILAIALQLVRVFLNLAKSQQWNDRTVVYGLLVVFGVGVAYAMYALSAKYGGRSRHGSSGASIDPLAFGAGSGSFAGPQRELGGRTVKTREQPRAV